MAELGVARDEVAGDGGVVGMAVEDEARVGLLEYPSRGDEGQEVGRGGGEGGEEEEEEVVVFKFEKSRPLGGEGNEHVTIKRVGRGEAERLRGDEKEGKESEVGGGIPLNAEFLRVSVPKHFELPGSTRITVSERAIQVAGFDRNCLNQISIEALHNAAETS